MQAAFQKLVTTSSPYAFPKMSTDGKRLICVVCGSAARGYNFGAITCMSCKIFFRRNAYTNLNGLQCHAGGNCEINQQTRKCCTYCRLVTCFRVGMKRQLFRIKNKNYKWLNLDRQQCERSSNFTQETPVNQYLYTRSPSFVRPSNTLAWSDRVQLSNNDWLLLNQLSFNFDCLNYHVLSKVHEMYKEFMSIGVQPLKIRSKARYIYDIVNSFVNTAIRFLQTIPHFDSLQTFNKQTIIRRNLKPFILFYSYYQSTMPAMKSLALTPYCKSSLDFIFSPSSIHLHDQMKYRIGRVSLVDPYFIKLILIIIAFSPNNIDSNEMKFNYDFDEYYHTIKINKIQEMYVELMWKYIMHRFGESYTILYFSSIVQLILRTQNVVFSMSKSVASFEQKFYENFLNLNNKYFQANDNT